MAGYLTLYCERTNKVDGNKWKPLDYKYVESGPEVHSFSPQSCLSRLKFSGIIGLSDIENGEMELIV